MTSFKEFVMVQDRNREIVHNNGWESCAVGDYAREALDSDIDISDIRSGRGIALIFENDPVLEECLNCNGIALVEDPVGYLSTDQMVINTYGDIQDYYNDKLKIVVEDEE